MLNVTQKRGAKQGSIRKQRQALWRRIVWAAALAVCPLSLRAAPAFLPVDAATGHPRVIILSDIGNEPDDQMSLVRLLLCANELDIEGLIATTSTWQKTAVHPEIMQRVIDAYGQVQPNLLLHASGFPSAARLKGVVFTGQTGYGMAATGTGKTTKGAEQIIQAVDRQDERPLWICLWGGGNTLAQALLQVRATRSREQVAHFVAKLRVSSISDQDDAGPWMRREFPSLFYIVEPSTQTGDEYYYATWTGISGDLYYRNGAGADSSLVTNAWLDANIRAKGLFGKAYPQFAFIMEGDTPSFLNLLDNGLASYSRPDWGGWDGRYLYRQPHGETHPIWTQGGDLFTRVTSQDTVTGLDGLPHTSDQATIWRWREAFQNDFAARMDWTIKDFAHANHNPLINVDGKAGTASLFVEAEVGKPLVLDASHTTDPDGQSLRFKWFVYDKAGAAEPSLASVELTGADTSTVTIKPTATCRAAWLSLGTACPASGTAHVILAVTDDGIPRLTSYRRIILTVHEKGTHP